MATLEEKLAEPVRQFPVLYDRGLWQDEDHALSSLTRFPNSTWLFLFKNTPRTHNLLLPWFRCRCLLRRMRIKSNRKSNLVISWVCHLECLKIKARLTLKARLMIPLLSCWFTLNQNFLPIPTLLTTPLPLLPSPSVNQIYNQPAWLFWCTLIKRQSYS